MSFMKYVWNRFVTKRNISYLLINIGNIPIMTLVSSFLAIYYIDILELDEYAVGTMFLIARIFDGVNDPIIGGIIDRIPGSKLKKFRKTLVVGTIVCSINYICLWVGPEFIAYNLKIIMAYISYLLLGVTFPIMDISLNSLLPVLTETEEDREILSSIKVIGYGIGTVMIEIIVPMVLSIFGANVNTYNGIIVFFVMFVLLLSVFGVCGLGENVQNTWKNNIKLQKERNAFKTFLKVFFDRNILSMFLAGLFFYTGNAVLAVSNTYYATYYLGNVKYLAFITVATYSLEMFVVLFIASAAKCFDSRKLFITGLLVAAIGLFIRYLPWKNVISSFYALMISSMIFGLGYGLAMILFYSIQAENAFRVYMNTGIEAEGTIAALMSTVNKFGKGIGGAIPLYVLGIMKSAEGDYTKYSLRVIDGLIPSILFAIGALIYFIFWEKQGKETNYEKSSIN